MSHSQNQTGRASGLRLYDINYILKKHTDTSFLLDNVQVGINGFIDWNQEHSRISFLQSYNTLNIVPALHRNTISFMGMSKRDNYIATNVIKDKFIALDRNNQLFCWSVLTGKLLSIHSLAYHLDYRNFDVFVSSGQQNTFDVEYKREWY